MRRLALFLTLILFGGFFTPTPSDRPNILVIIADDMGVDAWGRTGIGSNMASTPNLDSLADQGVTFTNAWAAPLCTPTRAAILSGMYGSKTDVLSVENVLKTSFETIFESVTAQTSDEYEIGVFGKWHVGPRRYLDHPNDQGADHFHGYLGGDPGDYSQWDRTINDVSDTSTDYVTSDITNAAIEWRAQQSSPWFMWMAHGAAHSPFHTPPDSLFTRDTPVTGLDQYLAMIESLDHETGRLLASMSESERENTVILFIGDNGTPVTQLQGFPNRRGKGSLYQGGVNVPMVVSGFGVERVAADEALVHVLDIHATILELIGEELPGGIHNSFSFHDRLSDPFAASRPYLISESQNDSGYGFAIRNDRYKAIEQPTGERQFFDLLVDPFELNDLAISGMNADEQNIQSELLIEASAQLNGWSCNDGIQNGAEDSTTCSVQTSVESQEVPFHSILESVYPNPTTGDVSLTLESGQGDVHISVFSLNGQKLKAEYQHSAGGRIKLLLDDLPAGMYIVHLRSGLGLGKGPGDTTLITKL